MISLSTKLRGEEVLLLPERAVFWPRAGALIVADPHFGKAAAFRAGGIPIPGGTTAEMLRRLDAALDRTGAARLLVLGDLLHARSGRAPRTLETVAAWRAARPGLRITLVRGNHDRRAGDPPAEWGVECLDAPVAEPPFVWLHEPPDPVAQAFLPASRPSPIAEAERSESFTSIQPQAGMPALQDHLASQAGMPALQGYPVAGHVHPAVALGGIGRGLTLPCFYFGWEYGLLPSFGEFTGTAVVRPRPGEGVFVLAGDEIIAK